MHPVGSQQTFYDLESVSTGVQLSLTVMLPDSIPFLVERHHPFTRWAHSNPRYVFLL